MADLMLMDSGSTINSMCNEKFVINVRPAKSNCELNTNNGTSVMTQESAVPGLGDAYFDISHRANIMSLFKSTEEHFVEMQSWKKNCFRVQPKKYGVNGEPDWTKPYVEFIASDEGLYVLKPSEEYTNAIDELD